MGNLYTPDGCLFASAQELEEATDAERKDIYEAYYECVREYACR